MATREFVELWFVLARRTWTSLVVVPTDPRGSSTEMAMSLAEVGKRLDEVPVTAITFRTLELETTRALAEFQRRIERESTRVSPNGRTIEAAATVVEEGDAAYQDRRPDRARGGPVLPAEGRVVVAIPSVLAEPLGLALTQASSVVVVAIELGRSRLDDARRTMDLIGRERIAGCILVSPP